MNNLYAGFGRVNVTPMRGIGIAGYFVPRFAEGVLDELEINAVVLACDDSKVILISMDHLGITADVTSIYREHISEVTGIPVEAVFIHATHTHTAAFLKKDSEEALEQEYYQMVGHRMADVARIALEDLKPAKMGYGIGQAPNVAFVRRYRMKDGSVKTNPGVNNPDVLEPIGEVDERVNVVRFDREGGETVVLANYGNHPDSVGGSRISADWPGFLRRETERILPNCKCIFFNGAQGDVNHVNIHPVGGDLNDMFLDFDDVSRGYGHARYIGRVVTGAVLQAFDKVKYVETDTIRCLQRVIDVPANMPGQEDMAEAYRIEELHLAGKDAELPYTGMMLTTVVAEAERMIRLEHGPETFQMALSAIAIGNVALIGIPGEPFTGIGRALKEAEGWDMVLPCCLVNGDEGYFPMKDAYDEGGYEARSSNYKAGVAELIIDEGKQLLREIR